MPKSMNEIADYLNNFEKRKRYMDKVTRYAIVFFFITYAYLLVDKMMGKFTPVNNPSPCNTAAAVDSVKFLYEYKLDSVIKTKQNRYKK